MSQFDGRRAGIAFLGGLINHVLSTDAYFRDFVVPYTNAATIVGEDFQDTEDLDGLFSGFDEETRHYSFDSWSYEGVSVAPASGQRDQTPGAHEGDSGDVRVAGRGEPQRVPDPQAALRPLHPEKVHEICGIPPETFAKVCRALVENSGPEPMSVGSWLLVAYGPATGAAAVSDLTGLLPRTGPAATLGAAAVGPAVAAYTAPLVANTAVPTWHEGHRELPFVFVGSAATAAGGLGMLTAPAGPARAALLGSALELVAVKRMQRGMGLAAEPLRTGRAGKLMKAAETLTVVGAVLGGVLGRRSRTAAALGGVAALAGSACTRFGIFHAGVASAEDPKYTVVPQRERLTSP